jgi:hypothetical protein
VQDGEGVEHLLPAPGDPDKYSPQISGVSVALDQPALHHTGGEFNSAVMLQLQPVRQLSNTGSLPGRQSSNGEQHLMLLRLQPPGWSRLFTKMQEPPELIAEFGERQVVALRQIQVSIHCPHSCAWSTFQCLIFNCDEAYSTYCTRST